MSMKCWRRRKGNVMKKVKKVDVKEVVAGVICAVIMIAIGFMTASYLYNIYK